MKRWGESLFIEGSRHIQEYFKETGRVMLIIGKGFDPRACTVLESLTKVVVNLTVLLIDYNDKSVKEDMNNESRSRENYKHLLELCENLNKIELSVPQYGGSVAKRTLIISESVRNVFNRQLIQNYDYLLTDVSAMPRGVAFSIIKRLMEIKSTNQQISVLVCENSETDDKIRPVSAEESAQYLPGFNTFSMSLEASEDETIWLPVLGMNEEAAFRTIAEYLKPVEICPVVPFPAIDARRSENILRRYGEAIFRERSVEKRNIIYVPENYPLLVYEKLYDTVRYYEKALHINEESDRAIKYVFSSQSSKLIDVGVLLAVMNLLQDGIKAGIVVTDNQGYEFSEAYKKENEELYCLCLDDNEFNW